MSTAASSSSSSVPPSMNVFIVIFHVDQWQQNLAVFNTFSLAQSFAQAHPVATKAEELNSGKITGHDSHLSIEQHVLISQPVEKGCEHITNTKTTIWTSKQ
jgi:hypothetical protein